MHIHLSAAPSILILLIFPPPSPQILPQRCVHQLARGTATKESHEGEFAPERSIKIQLPVPILWNLALRLTEVSMDARIQDQGHLCNLYFYFLSSSGQAHATSVGLCSQGLLQMWVWFCTCFISRGLLVSPYNWTRNCRNNHDLTPKSSHFPFTFMSASLSRHVFSFRLYLSPVPNTSELDKAALSSFKTTPKVCLSFSHQLKRTAEQQHASRWATFTSRPPPQPLAARTSLCRLGKPLHTAKMFRSLWSQKRLNKYDGSLHLHVFQIKMLKMVTSPCISDTAYKQLLYLYSPKSSRAP